VKFASDSSPTVTWHHIENLQDTIVDSSDQDIDIVVEYDLQTAIYNSTLSIANANPQDKGSYYCMIIDDDGYPISSRQADLDVGSSISHWPLDADQYIAGNYLDIKGGHDALAAGAPVFVEGVSDIEDTAVEITAGNGWASSSDFDLNSTEFSISVWSNRHGADAKELTLITALSGTTFLGSMEGLNGRWRHICITYDGLQGRIYIDGQNVYEEYWPDVELGNLNARIGHNEGDDFFNGVIDEVKLFDVALDDTQVYSLYTRSVDCLLLYGRDSDVSGPYHVPDCRVNFYDFIAVTNFEELILFTEDWLTCGLYPDCD
jgi:hypothetical protein